MVKGNKSAKRMAPGTIAQRDKFGLSDFIIAGALAVIAFVNLYLWHLPGIAPTSWTDVAVAEGIRPTTHLVGGYWNLFAKVFYRFIGPSGMQMLGLVVTIGMVVLCYGIVRELLSMATMDRARISVSRLAVMRVSAAFASLTFLFSDLIWMNGQFLTESGIQVALAMVSVEFLLVFLRKGHLRYGFLVAITLGLLSADSLLGVLLLLLFLIIYFIVINRVPKLAENLFQPAVLALGKWHITFVFVSAVIIGILLNCWTFVKCGGLLITEDTIGGLPMAYALEYWSSACSLADLGGWCLWIAIFFAPAVVTLLRFPSAADEDSFLSYAAGFVFVTCGLVAFSQSCSLDNLWFWTYVPVKSTALLTFGVLLNSITLAFAVAVFGVDAFCRDHIGLTRRMFGEEGGDDDELDIKAYTSTQIKVVKFLIKCSLPFIFAVAMLPGRVKSTSKEMMSFVNEGVRAMVEECEDAKYLFTEGSLDCAIELEAKRQGKRIYCVALLGGDGADGAYLRTREMTDDEDRYSFATDGGRGLRSWIRDKSENLKNCACQLGFDLWKRDGKAIPEIGGFVSRPAGWKSAEVAAKGRADAQELIAKYFDFYKKGNSSARVDKSIKDAFLAVQWRLSRMCYYRGENYDLAGDSEKALAEVALSKQLDECNETYIHLMKMVVERNKQMASLETPREGLNRALREANFKSAKLFADLILDKSPDDVPSNFALAMYYAQDRQFARAEQYLEKCISLMPTQPAFYNNLAMVQLESGKHEEAMKSVKRALALIPESSEVKDTKRKIEKAIAEKAQADEEAAADAEVRAARAARAQKKSNRQDK